MNYASYVLPYQSAARRGPLHVVHPGGLTRLSVYLVSELGPFGQRGALGATGFRLIYPFACMMHKEKLPDHTHHCGGGIYIFVA